MQYMVYHKIGESKVVSEVDKEMLIKCGDWFSCPLAAKQAKEADFEKVRKEEKKSAKDRKAQTKTSDK